jgi:hypothetical protein
MHPPLNYAQTHILPCRPDFEEVLARLQPLHDELRSRRRTNSSLATASAPGVSRTLAMGLLPRTRSSDLRDQTAATLQARLHEPPASL